MTIKFRDRLIAAVTFFSGLYFFLEFLLPEQIGGFKFGAYNEEILRGVTVVGSMAIGLGLINILRVHGGMLAKMQRGWPNSLALLVGMFVMFYVQGSEFLASQDNLKAWKPLGELTLYLKKVQSDHKDNPAQAAEAVLLVSRRLNSVGEQLIAHTEAPDIVADSKFNNAKQNFQLQLNQSKERAELLRGTYARQAAATDDASRAAAAAGVEPAMKDLTDGLKPLTAAARDLSGLVFQQHPIHRASHLLTEGFFVPLGAAMFALLAFYIANAAYRSFRVKSVEASVMMLTAVIVILGQIPFGPIYISDKLPMVRLWLLQNINTPGNRAIYFGATIAAFAMAIRMWFSLEKNPLAIDQQEAGGED